MIIYLLRLFVDVRGLAVDPVVPPWLFNMWVRMSLVYFNLFVISVFELSRALTNG